MLRAGVPLPLGGRAFDLMLALIKRRGEVLSKDKLMRQVWPGLVIEANNLTVYASTLRRAIGQAAIGTESPLSAWPRGRRRPQPSCSSNGHAASPPILNSASTLPR